MNTYKWKSNPEVRRAMYEELSRLSGPYSAWVGVMQPDVKGTGQEFVDTVLEPVVALLNEAFPAEASTSKGEYTVPDTRQQINYALQQGVRARGYDHGAEGMADTCVLNLEAAVAAGFMTIEDIHSSAYRPLSQVITPTQTPVLFSDKATLEVGKKGPAKLPPALAEYCYYNRSTEDWDWRQVDIMIRQLAYGIRQGKKAFSQKELGSMKKAIKILQEFRNGTRPIEYIMPRNISSWEQIRNVEFDTPTIKLLGETIPDRGIDQPCLGVWADDFLKIIKGRNGNHRKKVSLEGIKKGLLPYDFKMPFMVITQEEERELNEAFEMMKSMANTSRNQGGNTTDDVKLRATTTIKRKGKATQFAALDMSLRTKRGKNHPDVVKLVERMKVEFGGGDLSSNKVTRSTYKAIEEIRLKKDGKIKYLGKDQVLKDFKTYSGMKEMPALDKEKKAKSFSHGGEGQHVGVFGATDQWRWNMVDASTGTTENTYYLGSPMDAAIGGWKLGLIFIDTANRGNVQKIWDVTEKKFEAIRTYYFKAEQGLGASRPPLPDMVAVPNFFEKDVDVTFREEQFRAKSTTNFILVSRKELEEWINDPVHPLVPREWFFEEG
jgi:hypothetical protein